MTAVSLLHLEEVDSTNLYVRSHYDELADGTLVLAGRQTAGRGRLGRKWQSPSGRNIYATLTIKRPGVPFHAGCVVGLAALDTLRALASGLNFFIKWPNDVYCCDCKIAGILCEGVRVANGGVQGIAAGVGININLSPEEISAIDQRATSLLAELGCEFCLKKVAGLLAQSLERHYITYSNDPELLVGNWKKANGLIGQRIALRRGDGQMLEGIFSDIAPDGSLILADGAGGSVACNCGDVRIDRDRIDWAAVSARCSAGVSQNMGTQKTGLFFQQ